MKMLLFLFLLVALIPGCARRGLSPEDKAIREQKVRLLLAQGNKHLRGSSWDDLDKAQAAYGTARDLSREDPRAIDGLGCVAWRKGNSKLAEFYFRRAVELDSNYDRPLVHLALIADSRGDKQASRELLQMAIALNPLNFRAHNNYAAVLMNSNSNFKSEERSKALGEAHRALLKAYELSGPEEPYVTENLATLSQRRGW